MLNTVGRNTTSMLPGCRAIVLGPRPVGAHRDSGRSDDFGVGCNRAISSGRKQEGRRRKSGAGIGQAAGFAAGGGPAAMRDRPRGGLLLGAGRRATLQLLYAAGRA